VSGVRLVALDEAGRVLLIRHSYGSRCWTTPGGGLGRREDPVAAACRELREETCSPLLEPRLIAVVEEDLHGATNVVHVVGGRLGAPPRVDGREVLALRLFAPDALPPEIPPAIRAGLPGWIAAVR